MALNLIFTYNILVDISPFNAGDKVYCYWDDVASDFVVKRDGNTETFGSNVALFGDSGTYEANAATWFSALDTVNTIVSPDPSTYSTRSNTVAHSGTYSAKYTQPDTVNNSIAFQGVTMTSGKTYRVYCWVYNDPANQIATSGTLSLVPSTWDNVAFTNSVKCTLADCTSTWVQISVDVSLIAGSGQQLIYLTLSGYPSLTTGKFLYFDDFTIKEITGFTTSTTTITTGPDLGLMTTRDSRWSIDNALPYDELSKAYVSKYQFCVSTTLNQFTASVLNPPFPYVLKNQITNHPSCAITPIVCDIQFIGVPVVVKASNPFSSDGSITVVATSSHGIVRYSLQTDPGDYNNFTDTSGVYTVGRGTKKIFAIDPVNCKISINVEVGIVTTNDPTTGQDPTPTNDVKYRMEHIDLFNNVTARVDILERGFTGTLTEVKGGMPPFVRTLREISINNKFEPLRPTSAEINLLSETDLAFMGLFSQDDRKFQVKYYKPVGTLLWTGFIIPSVFNQPYTENPPYITTIQATDNLTELGSLDFLDKDGNKFIGKNNLVNIVVSILSKLSLSINIRIACNVREDTHSTNNSNAFFETYQEMSSFYEDDGTPWTCERVLQSILIPFGAKIVQENGVWNIIRVEEQTASYYYREYTSIGAYSSTGTYNPIVAISSPSLRMNAIFESGSGYADLEMVPAYGTITIRRKLHAVKNLITNGSFDIEQFVNNQVNGWTINFSSSSIVWTIEKIIEKFSLSRLQSQQSTTSVDSIQRTQQANNNSLFSSIISKFRTSSGGLNLVTKGDYALALSGFDNSDGSYNTKVALVNNVPFPIQFGTNDSFTFSFNYRINLNTSTRLHTDPLWTRIVWSIQIGAYYYNDREGWTSDSNKADNYIFVDKFNEDNTFEITLGFPPTIHGVINTFKASFKFYGSGYILSATDPISAGLTTVDKNVGYKILVYFSGKYYYYTLTQGTEATSSPDVFRPVDYDGTTNPVYFKLDKSADEITPTYRIYLDVVSCLFNPNNEKSPDEEILTQVINSNYKENLEVVLEGGDVPQASATLREIHNKQYIYDNYFKDYSSQPTTRWTRSAVPAESTTIQSIFLKSLVNQYQYPTFKVSGSFIGFTELNFLTTFKHETEQPSQTLVNEDFTGSLTGWTNDTGGPEAYYYDGGTARTDYAYGVLRQTNNINFYAGQRIRVDFSIERLNSVGERGDWLYILMRNPATVQMIVVAQMTGDGTFTRSVKFTISQDCTNIAFYIRDVSGTAGTCSYKMNYFRLKGLIVTRYFTTNSMEIDGKNNMYRVGMMQLVPVVPSTDPDVDDSGEGNTNTEGGSGGGTSGGGSSSGSGFTGGFSSGFGSGFDTLQN